MLRLGSMVVRLALENLAGYKADLDKAAQMAKDGADKISESMDQAAKLAEWQRKRTEAQTKELTQAIDKQVSALVQEAATFGMSAGQVTIYKLAMEGATEAQLNQAKAALITVNTLQASKDVAAQFGSALKTGAMVAAAGAAAAYVAFEKLIGNVSKYQDLAEQTGGDPAGLAALRTAADVGGASIESLAMASTRLQKSLAATDDESKGVGRALAAIGIRVEEFKNLGADQQIRSVAKAMNEYADGGDKVAVVQEILGRGAASLLPALKELGNETQINNTLTNEQIQLADNYKDAQARAKSELLQFAEGLAVSALPAVTIFTGAVKDTISELVGVGSTSGDLAKNGAVKEFATGGALLLANLADIAYDVAGAFRFVGNNLGAMVAIAEANLRLDFAGARAIGAASEEQNVQILKGLGLADKVQARIDAMNAAAGNLGGQSGEDESKGGKQLDFHSKQAKAIREVTDENEKLIASIRVGMAATDAEAEAGRKLTPVEKEIATLYEKISTGKTKYSLETLLTVDALMQEKLAKEANAIATEKAIKQDAASNAEYAKGLDTLDKSIEKIQSETEKEVAKAAALGLTKIAAAELAAVELERDADAIDRNATRAEGLGLEGETTKRYREQAQALRDLAAAKRAGALRETEIDTEKEITNERKKGWEETDRLAREVFVNQEISAQRVGDVLKKALKSAMYEATLKPLVFQMYTSVAGGGGGGGAGGSALGGAANSAAGSYLGNLAFAGSTLGAATGAVGTGFMATMTGSSVTGAASAYSAAGMTGVSTGLTVGAAIPYIAAAYAVFSMLKGGDYVKSMGASDQTFGANGSVSTAAQDYANPYGGGLNSGYGNADANKITTGMYDTYKKSAAALGITQNGAVRFAYGSNDSDGGKTSIGGGSFNSGEFKTTPEAVSLAASRAVFSALQGSDLPAYLKAVFNKVDAGSATQAQINETLSYAQSLKEVRAAMAETRDPLQILKDSVATGFADLGTSAATFKTDFVAAIDAGITPENLSKWDTLRVSMNNLADAAAANAAQLDQARNAYISGYYTATEQKQITYSTVSSDLAAVGINFTPEQISSWTRGDIRNGVDFLNKDRGTTTGDAQYAAFLKAANVLDPLLTRLDAVVPTASYSAASNPVVADEALTAWKAATEAIVQTMADLQMTMLANGPDKLERLQAQLVIDMAAAKAGSLSAMQNLPELARATSSAFAQQNTSHVDQAVFNARLVQSLGTVASFDVGTDYVPRDMLAMVHEGERITPKAFNPTRAEGGGWLAGGGDTEVARLLREMASRLQAIAVYAGDTNTSSKTMADVLQQATRGRPLRTTVVT